MLALRKAPHPAVILTSANALMQKVPPPQFIGQQTIMAAPGNRIDMNDLARRLELNGFERTGTVRDVGEFAVRGGIVDIFAPGTDEPLRLDFFGDTLESIRAFDPASQRTTGQRKNFELAPMSEVTLSAETVSRFRTRYLQTFGAATRDDALYQAVSESRRFAGMEHWLPFFYDRLATVFDYAPDMPVVFEHLAHEAMAERHTLILDHYDARRRALDAPGASGAGGSVPYKPVAPGELYLSANEVMEAASGRAVIDLNPFQTRRRTRARRFIMPGPSAGARLRRSGRRAMSMCLTRPSLTSAMRARRGARSCLAPGRRDRSTG